MQEAEVKQTCRAAEKEQNQNQRKEYIPYTEKQVSLVLLWSKKIILKFSPC